MMKFCVLVHNKAATLVGFVLLPYSRFRYKACEGSQRRRSLSAGLREPHMPSHSPEVFRYLTAFISLYIQKLSTCGKLTRVMDDDRQ